MATRTLQIVRGGVAAGLIAASAVCFLRYAGWAASYSGWYGLPSYADKLKTAHGRAFFYFWTTVFLQSASVFFLWTMVPLSHSDLPEGPKFLARLGISTVITIGSGALLVLLINRVAPLL